MIKSTTNHSAVRWKVNDGAECIGYCFVGELRFTTVNGNGKKTTHAPNNSDKSTPGRVSLHACVVFARRCRRGYGRRRQRRRTGSLVSDTVNLAPPPQTATVVAASAHMRRSRPRLASSFACGEESRQATIEMFAFAGGILYG